MNRFLKILALCFVVMMVAAPALAQEPTTAAAVVTPAAAPATVAVTPLISFSSAFGAGLIIIGAGLGIAKIGSTAVESMARQPEVAGNIQTGMIIAAALIEGATFFALIVCIIGG